MLSKLRRKCVPRGTPFLGPPPTKRRRYPIAQKLMTGLLMLLALGNTNIAWANDPPNFISGSASPTTINVGESIHFNSVWSDEGDFIVEVQVQYCQQGTSVCETVTLDFIDGTDEPAVGFEIDVPITQAGIYTYQFRARDEQPLYTPIHTYEDGSIQWHDSGTFTVVENTTTPEPNTPDDPVTPPPMPEPNTPDDPVTPPPNQGTTDCTQVTEIPQAECEALVALYNSTNGPNWSDSPANNWNMTNEPCSWEGVHCNCENYWNREEDSCRLDYHVFAIARYNKNLIGALPDLSRLNNLYLLRLGNNYLSGSIPNFSHFKNLATLDLSMNQFSGSIPNNLSHLTNLEWLYLSKNNLSGEIPSSLSSLTFLDNFRTLTLNDNCLTASDPTLIAFLDEKNPTWKTTQNNCSVPSEENENPEVTDYILSGTVSLPSGDIASEGGININVYVEIYDENNDYSESGYDSVHIPENQSSASFTLLIPDEPNIKWILGVGCHHWEWNWEWNEELGKSERSSGKCGRYVNDLLYGKSGMTMTYRYDNFFQGGQNYPNANLVLQHGVQISGTISLPEGRVAPAGGIDEIWIAINEPDADIYYSSNSFEIAENESSVPYAIRVVNDPGVEWLVEYWCDSCEEEAYYQMAYYSPIGTTTDYPTNLLQGGQEHSNINLTLLPLDAETPTDETQPPTVTISEYPSTIGGKESINLSGTTSDNTVKITWQNNQGGEGEATMTTKDDTIAWTLDNLPLKIGENVITITAYDDTGLQSSEEITITVPKPDFNISAVYPDKGTYNRNEKVLTVWWTTTDTSHSNNVKIFLFNGNVDKTKILSESTPDDEQETFIIPSDIDAGNWKVCITSVPMTAADKCSSDYITIQ